MLSAETLEEYRRMTPSERLAMTFAMMRDAGKYLTAGPEDLVDRRFELIRRQNDQRTRNILAGLARSAVEDGKPLSGA